MKDPEIICIDTDSEKVNDLNEEVPTTGEIIKHAIRHMKQEDFFNMDMLLRYQLIEALKKGD